MNNRANQFFATKPALNCLALFNHGPAAPGAKHGECTRMNTDEDRNGAGVTRIGTNWGEGLPREDTKNRKKPKPTVRQFVPVGAIRVMPVFFVSFCAFSWQSLFCFLLSVFCFLRTVNAASV